MPKLNLCTDAFILILYATKLLSFIETVNIIKLYINCIILREDDYYYQKEKTKYTFSKFYFCLFLFSFLFIFTDSSKGTLYSFILFFH